MSVEQPDIKVSTAENSPQAANWESDIKLYHDNPQDASDFGQLSLTLDDLEMQDISSKVPHPPTSVQGTLGRIIGSEKPQRQYKLGGLPYLGPADPPTWPLHKTLFLTGHLFPPCWIAGVFINAPDDFAGLFKWRCQVMAMITVIVVIALLILELGF
ncbi:hypothetical protein NLI96_g9614 [Meripilus lineatus]|uniref:Uncharacterized protein n=1 Tax=Meripilus lineatus TaxID=2056292 RepID=A0AAD5UV49_9APHY|nr:hypothetical protein NLI96_g9614 [Physisporinus lineatus]